jgi:hypothetical protein
MNPRVAVLLTPVVAVGVIGAIAAGAPQAKQRGDAVAEEVRQLRLAFERAAEISARATLVIQRSNLVQARLSTLSWELADIRSQMVRASSEVARYTAVVGDYERQFPEIASDASIAVRMPQYGQAKGQLAAQVQLEQNLRSREGQVMASLTSEQAQWNELMERVAAIEQLLNTRRD